MKCQDQRIREIDSELVDLRLTCGEVVRVIARAGPVARAVGRLPL